jgi:hypothetical protein
MASNIDGSLTACKGIAASAPAAATRWTESRACATADESPRIRRNGILTTTMLSRFGYEVLWNFCIRIAAMLGFQARFAISGLGYASAILAAKHPGSIETKALSSDTLWYHS